MIKHLRMLAACGVTALLALTAAPASAVSADAGSAAASPNRCVGGPAKYREDLTSTYYLDASGSGGKGTHVISWDRNGGANQSWCLEHVAGAPSDYFYIHPSYNLSLCMDIPGGNLQEGTQIILWSCNGRWNQRFGVSSPAGDSTYFIESILAPNGHRIFVSYAGRGNYVQLSFDGNTWKRRY
ncbi:RICIN domain-containing protein [Streptomyces sp. NPDC004533]|uniref:RICIN domain-containing protein n=1 Tax=unclassified Streptomyces TaxID=2593676 RepID=UPI0033A201DD